MNVPTRRPPLSHSTRTLIASLYLCSLLVIAPSTLIAGPWHASAPETAHATVSVAEFDVTTAAGLIAAQARLAAAAKRACNKFSDSLKVDDSKIWADCYR